MGAGRDGVRVSEQHAATRFAVLRRQIPFAAVVLVSVLVVLVWAPGLFGHPNLFLPLGCAVTATVLAAVVPWPRLPRWTTTVVPLLNMLAIALAEYEGLPAGGLVLLPVLVLARADLYGMVLAIVGGVAALWIPTLMEYGFLVLNAETILGFILRPTVVVAAAIMLFLVERRSSARLALLAGQSVLVEEVLEDTTADRELLETVLDTITTRIVVLDRDGRVSRVNPAAARVHAGAIQPGRPAQDVSRELQPPTDEARPADSPLVRAARGEPVAAEIWWTEGADGARTAYRASAASFTGGAGGTVLALEDLTQELEALARREEFVSAVSHELRTPLTSVVGYLDLALEDASLSASGRRSLRIAERNARRLEILIENLLAAARAGEHAPPGPVDLSTVVREVVEDQTPRATEARVGLTVTAPLRCLVLGTVDRVTQVVDNLVSNAIKYSGANTAVAITVDDGDAGHAPGLVRLVVRDHGAGIPAEDLPHVFDRFYRAPSARESTVQGTGLGLPITRGIIEDMGGHITLDSAVGQGTCVTVDLPTGRSR